MLCSVVIPVYNEREVLPQLVAELRTVLSGLAIDYELLFVDDGSRDGSLEMLEALAAVDGRVKLLELTRNFGHQAAVTAGLDFADGDAVVVMDADLQDPPDLLPEMLRLWGEGYDLVSPQRISRRGEPALKRATAKMFYWLMRKAVDPRLRDQVGDFRLYSRRAVDVLRRLRERHRFLRGMAAWLGLSEVLLPFERRPRAAGQTKYPFLRMCGFAWTAISSFSAFPLRLTTVLGLAFCAASLIYAVWAAYAAVVMHHVVPGWTSLVMLQCLFSGIVLVSLGAIGEYVSRIFEELKGRPLYLVGRAANIDPQRVGPPCVAAPRREP